MNKNISDYLGYYIGQDIQIPAIEEGDKWKKVLADVLLIIFNIINQ